MFSVLAPSSTSTRAVAGFVTGNSADSFACMSAGSAPLDRICEKADRSPRSAISTLRMPCSAARAMSSRPCTTCSWPREAAASIAPAGAAAVAEASQPAFGRANSDTSTRASRATPAMSSSSRVGEHEHAAALRHAVHRHVEPRGGRRAPRAGSPGPRCWGSRSGSARRRRNRSGESGSACRSPARQVHRRQRVSDLAHRARPPTGRRGTRSAARPATGRTRGRRCRPRAAWRRPATKSSRRSAWASWTVTERSISAGSRPSFSHHSSRIAFDFGPLLRRAEAVPDVRRARRSAAASPWGPCRRS